MGPVDEVRCFFVYDVMDDVAWTQKYCTTLVKDGVTHSDIVKMARIGAGGFLAVTYGNGLLPNRFRGCLPNGFLGFFRERWV